MWPPFSWRENISWFFKNSLLTYKLIELIWSYSICVVCRFDWELEAIWVAPRLTQLFILPRLIKWIPKTPGELKIKSKLNPSCCSAALRQLNSLHRLYLVHLKSGEDTDECICPEIITNQKARKSLFISWVQK